MPRDKHALIMGVANCEIETERFYQIRVSLYPEFNFIVIKPVESFI